MFSRVTGVKRGYESCFAEKAAKRTSQQSGLLTIGNPDQPSTLQGGKPFNRPTHMAVSPKSGDIFVTDGYGNSRVHRFAPDGKLLEKCTRYPLRRP